jgi:transglutaminase-like putative cysteine protease
MNHSRRQIPLCATCRADSTNALGSIESKSGAPHFRMPDDVDESFTPATENIPSDVSLTDNSLFEPEPMDSAAEVEAPASVDRAGLARGRVKIEPPAEWVTIHDVDFAAPAKPGVCETLLVDCQAHASRHASYWRRVQRLATFDAVQQAAKWQLTFDPATQTTSIHSIRLRRGKEVLERTSLAKMQFLQREQGLSDSESIDGDITLLLILEDVRVDDILDVAFTKTTTPRFLAHRYSVFWVTSLPYPAREYLTSVRFPAGTEIRWKSYPTDLPPAIRTVGGETEWSWQWKNVAVAKTEPNTPWWHFRGGWVQVSSFASWEEIAAGLKTAWERSFDEEELNTAARRIATSAAGAADCVEKAFSLVQDEIRYLSMNIDMGGHIPADPSTTLRRRFGDCKDKSFLLAQLLRRLGYSARPVLVHTKLDRMLERFLPSPYVFDHVVAEFEFEGRRRWIDATIAMQGGGVLSRGVPHVRRGLPIGPGVTDLESLPMQAGAEAPAYYGLCETFRLGTIGQPVCLKVILTLRGADADDQRRRFHHRGVRGVSLERERWYRSLFAGAKRICPLEWKDDRAKNELVMAEAFELPQAMRLVPATGRVLFEHRPYLIRRMLSTPVRSKPRRLPLALAAPQRMEHTIELEWAPLPMAKGRRLRERNTHFLLRLEENRAMGRWSSHYDFELLSESLDPGDLQSFEKHVGAIASYLYLGVFGPKGRPTNTKPWTGSLLPGPRRASGRGSPSGLAATPSEVQAVTALASGVPCPDQPAEPLLSVPATDPATTIGIAKSKPTSPATAEPARPAKPTMPESPRDPLASPLPRRRRRRKPWPTAVKIALVLFAIAFGCVALFALLYSTRP